MAKKKLELPPALQTRTSNRSRVVGAPDMPRPKRTHEEVVEEERVRQEEESVIRGKQQVAVAQLAAIEQESGEHDSIVRSHSQPVAKTIPEASDSTLRKGREIARLAKELPAAGGQSLVLRLRLPRHGVEEGPPADMQSSVEAAPTEPPTGGAVDKEPAMLDDDEEGLIEEPGSDASGDEYRPQDDNSQGESEMDDGDDVQVEEVVAKVRAKSRGKKGARKMKVRRADVEGVKATAAAQTASSAKGVGKRKPEDGGTTRTQVAVAPAPGALVLMNPIHLSNWEGILESNSTSSTEDVPSRATTQRRSVSVSSSASTVPVSSSANSITGDSSDADDMFLTAGGDGFADDNDNSQPPPSPPRTSRYRQRNSSPTLTAEPEFDLGSRKVTAIKDVLTKVLTRAHTPATKKPPATSTVTPAYPTAPSSAPSKGSTNNPPQPAMGRAAPDQGTATTGSGKTPKSKLSDLPVVLRKSFNTRFVPLVRQYLGVQHPWAEISLGELRQLHRKAFGEELSRQHPLDDQDHCFKLIHYRMNDWHTKLWQTAIATFQEILDDARAQEVDSDSEDADADTRAEPAFSTPEQVGIYAEWLLGDIKKKAPFYWKVWNRGIKPEGRLQSDLIIGTFAYHLSELLTIEKDERVLEFPTGALTLATLAVTHALTHYVTGEFVRPDGRPGFFSFENYGDTVEFRNGGYVTNNRTTRVLNVVKDLTDNEWTAIYEAAYTVVERRAAAAGKGRRGKKGVAGGGGATAAAAVAEDDDLMLV